MMRLKMNCYVTGFKPHTHFDSRDDDFNVCFFFHRNKLYWHGGHFGTVIQFSKQTFVPHEIWHLLAERSEEEDLGKFRPG